jgi:hypothetical protein
MRRIAAVCVAFAIVFCLPRSLRAIVAYAPMDSVPVDRLITNAGKYVKAHPQDSEGFYLLGRLHSLAFAENRKSLEVWRWARGSDPKASLPQVAFLEPVPRPERTAPGPNLTEKPREHLVESLRNYRRATELKPKQAVAYLGLGWMLEQGALVAPEVDAPFAEPPRRVSAQEWRAQALASYRYLIANYVELVRANPQPESPQALLMEASQGILRLLPGPNLSPAEKTETDRARKAITAYQDSLKNKPGGQPRIISPIIFPLRGAAPLEALLAPGRVVSFDLAGNGVPEKWPWVNADAGFLVWDPENRQRIESGRQLFGSVTWWMFWRDGYQALAALDDDGNGWLEGNELAGIAIWRDINGNGVCDPGEMISLRDAGIVRIAVHATGRTSGMPYNPQGIQLKDGSSLPTYDWTPVSVTSGAGAASAKER